MFKTLEEVKKFINWCKANKVKSFKQGDVSFELSELSFVEGLNDLNVAETAQEDAEVSNFDDTQNTKEEEDLLYYSSN